MGGLPSFSANLGGQDLAVTTIFRVRFNLGAGWGNGGKKK
jgi:hypothetical protein